MGYTRRRALKAAGGIVAAASVADVGVAEASDEGSIADQQVRYIKKHAALRAAVYERFANRYVVSEEELESQFRDSYSYNLKEIILGFIDTHLLGGAIDVTTTVEWYLQTRNQSSLSLILDAGTDPKSFGGYEAESAQTENLRLADRARYAGTSEPSVYEAAAAWLDAESANAKAELVSSIDAELQRLNDIDAIEAWSDIDPGDYVNVVSHSDARTIAESVETMAAANQKLLAAFRADLKAQKRLLTGSSAEQPFFLEMLTLYEDNIGELENPIPFMGRDEFFDETINVNLMAKTGTTNEEDLENSYFVRTKPDGHVAAFDLVGSESANLEIYTTKAVVRRIADSDDPVAEARRALDAGEIEYHGRGYWNTAKYTTVKTVSWAKDSVEDTVDEVGDFIDGLL